MTETLEKNKIGLEIIADSLVKYCQYHQYGLAIWSLPGTQIQQVLVSFTPEIIHNNQIESLPTGFVIAAFENGSKSEKLFLKADISFKLGDDTDGHLYLADILPGIEFAKSGSEFSITPAAISGEIKHAYTQSVEAAIESINTGRYKKLVLARKKNAHIKGKISAGNVFKKILAKYPRTFNSLIYTPQFGLWIGATPETLVSRNSEQIFKTVALAGTQNAFGKTEKEAVWSQKEIEEQAYVSKFIVERLKKIRLREFEDIGPKTIRVGELFHLKTEFLVNLKEVDFPNLLSDMLEMLHPTSAVCGMPKEEAMEFVLNTEDFRRELYSGYLGPVNFEGATHIFVNLRCAKITENEVSFYAGAGITEDSAPEKEFQETELKMQSLEDCFRVD